MSRVNHKLVKQRLNENRSKITDRQFFSSRLLAGHFEDMAAAQTRRYHYNRRVRVNLYWKPKEEHTASTNNQVIRINAGSPTVTNVKGRENRYQMVCGLFAHELGHVLYTDFLLGQTHVNSLSAYRWYPYPPDLKTLEDVRNEKEFWTYAKADPKNLEAIQYTAHFLSNVIEDGYVENRMLENFPGTLGYALEQFRNRQFKEMPTVTDCIEKEESGEMQAFGSILQLLLSYAKFGEIKYGDEPLSDPRIQMVFGLISNIDSALLSRSAKERLSAVNLILVRCWDYLKEFLEICKQKLQDAESSSSGSSVTDVVAGALHVIAGTSEEGAGDSAPVPESGGAGDISEPSPVAIKRAWTHKDAEKDSKDGSGAGVSGNPGGSSEAAGNCLSGDDATGKQKDVSETEEGRIPLQQTETVSEPVSGSEERNDEYQRECYERAASDIERILDKMAEKAACEQLENDRLRELNEAAQNISYGDIHAGVNIRVNRMPSVEEGHIEQYHAISGPLLTISRQLQKSLVKQLQENRRGGKQTGLIMGRRLDAQALGRNRGKVFYKHNLPNEIPELAVGLLLDESGSMRSCDRCTYARAAAIILYDFCQSLEIPVIIYGHSTEYDSGKNYVALYSYAEFESFDQDDKYRLMDIGARSENRDGAALRYVAEQLSKRTEAVKMLILVSDGQPYDDDYYGTAAEEDLRGIKQEYQRKGILFVAAAIGDDKENIQRIYGDSFLDITDLNQLPVKLTAVVKKHIIV